MHYCLEYDERILNGDAAATAHVAGCVGCRVAEVDMRMSWAVTRAAMAPPVKPPLWPELLDAAGWTSAVGTMLVVTASVAPWAVWGAFAGVMVAGAAYFGFKGWREIG